MPEAPRFAFRAGPSERLLEVPPTTVKVFDRNFPAAGGGYFRLLPYRVSRWCMKRVNETDGRPCVFYFHPWEIDAGQPRQANLSAKTRFRHYVNLGRTEAKLRCLLSEFAWDRMDRVMAPAIRDAA